ncbi:non-heme iron oxygenase ferredoxin subunit [Aeromicrobium sp. CF3.5]|uniref:non-heme iron oxygenase ferredoxin subunit n=1 Tax=Aeromicrobium sp. CF3.5 TaxID=3373078 RepID=UPI003EE551C1
MTEPAHQPLPDDRRIWRAAAATQDLVHDAPLHVDVAGHSVCLVRAGDAVHALRDECSHGQVRLSAGDVADGLIECWQHGSCFDLTTGAPTGPPATSPVSVYPVRIVHSVIEISLPR